MKFQHLISVSDLNDKDIVALCEKAQKKTAPPKLTGPSRSALGLVFLEPSTRTRVSFERAAQILNRRYVILGAEGTSVEKGESLFDSLQCLRSYGIETFVVRTKENGALEKLRQAKLGTLINAGTGTEEHPTQALGDLAALLELVKGDWEKLQGFKLGIIGDLRRSRVARSWSLLAPRFGIELKLMSPKPFKPTAWGTGLPWADQKDLHELDAVMALRVQKERAEGDEEALVADFIRRFRLSGADMGPKRFLMHPGPVNWGVELSPELLNSPRSLVVRQMEMGLRVRAAILDAVL